MEMDVKLKVLGIIVACGFAAGFVIEQRASAMVDAPVHGIKMKKREVVDAGDDDDEEEGGAGGSRAGADKRTNKAGGGEPNGNVSAAPASAGGGGPQQPKQAEQPKPSGDAKAAAKVADVLSGRKAIDAIVGNTLKNEAAQTQQDMAFYATRGLVGRRTDEGFVVRRWSMKGEELCETDAAGVPACRAIQVRLDGDSKGGPGAVIGHVVGTDVSILKGNIADFPTFIPGVEQKPKQRQGFVGISSERPEPGLAGAQAFQAVVGKILAESKSSTGLNLIYFDPEGAMLDIRRATRQGEARVSITPWALRKDMLCRDSAGGAKPVCVRPQILEGGIVRLGSGNAAPTYVETQG